MSLKRKEISELNDSIGEEEIGVTVSAFQNVDILRNTVSYVGKQQYRFVAAINKDFKDAYLNLFPYYKETYFDASTLDHLNISFEWTLIQRKRNSTPCNSAARHGSLEMLKYVRSMGFAWGPLTCSAAARSGHLHILKYLRENRCR
jgi:hypothetical protein